MSDFEAPSYVDDGMEVWIRWRRTETGTSLLKCTVACAAGNHVRVVNEAYKVNKWCRLDDLLVPTLEIIQKIHDS